LLRVVVANGGGREVTAGLCRPVHLLAVAAGPPGRSAVRPDKAWL